MSASLFRCSRPLRGVVPLLVTLLSVSCSPRVPERAGEEANPVLPVQAADPHAALFGGRYYLYATGAGALEEGFAVWSSPDLTRWTSEGTQLRLSDVGWASKEAWAPAAAERNGRYFFYFSAESRIGVAEADSPSGTFREPLGKPLVP